MCCARLALATTLGILCVLCVDCGTSDKTRQRAFHSEKPIQDTPQSSGELDFAFPRPDASTVSNRQQSMAHKYSELRNRATRGTLGHSLRRRVILPPNEVNEVLFQIKFAVNTLSENIQRLSDNIKGALEDLKHHKPATAESLKRIEAVQERSSDKLTAIETSFALRSGLLTQGVQELVYSLKVFREQDGQRLDKIEQRLQDAIRFHTQSNNLVAERLASIEASMEKQCAHWTETNKEVKDALISIQEKQKIINTSVITTEAMLSGIRAEGLKNKNDMRPPVGLMSPGHDSAFFNVENVTELVRKANASGYASIRSDLFLVGGYTAKIILTAHLSKQTLQLAVYLSLCPGPMDSLLQWPLRNNYTVVIFHPKNTEKDMQKTVSFMSAICATEFQKPKGKCNTGCGFDILSWESVQRGGYLYNDTVTVGVRIRSEASSGLCRDKPHSAPPDSGGFSRSNLSLLSELFKSRK